VTRESALHQQNFDLRLGKFQNPSTPRAFISTGPGKLPGSRHRDRVAKILSSCVASGLRLIWRLTLRRREPGVIIVILTARL